MSLNDPDPATEATAEPFPQDASEEIARNEPDSRIAQMNPVKTFFCPCMRNNPAVGCWVIASRSVPHCCYLWGNARECLILLVCQLLPISWCIEMKLRSSLREHFTVKADFQITLVSSVHRQIVRPLLAFP